MPDPILDQLNQLKDKEYGTAEEFLAAVKPLIDDAAFETYKSLLLKYAGPDVLKDSITFDISVVGSGTYLLRIQVDGAESVLEIDRDENSPTFKQIIGPKVTIP